jgi:hypothetical protein
MTNRGKRAKIPPQSLLIIMRRALEYPRRPRTTVAEDLQKELQREHHDVPELEVLERKISNFRNHEINSPLDDPWYVSTLPQYEIPPESLPRVLELFIEKIRTEAVHITIREARWIGRLAFVIKDNELLWRYALSYVWTEKALADTGLEATEIRGDRNLYEDMRGKDFSSDEVDDFRQKERLAKAKQRLMEIRSRKNKAKNAVNQKGK